MKGIGRKLAEVGYMLVAIGCILSVILIPVGVMILIGMDAVAELRALRELRSKEGGL